MKYTKCFLYPMIFVFLMSCGIVDGETVIKEAEGEKISWIKYRTTKVWYLKKYENDFEEYSRSYVCDEILLYLKELLFTCEVQGVVYVESLSATYHMEEGWSWKR